MLGNLRFTCAAVRRQFQYVAFSLIYEKTGVALFFLLCILKNSDAISAIYQAYSSELINQESRIKHVTREAVKPPAYVNHLATDSSFDRTFQYIHFLTLGFSSPLSSSFSYYVFRRTSIIFDTLYRLGHLTS